MSSTSRKERFFKRQAITLGMKVLWDPGEGLAYSSLRYLIDMNIGEISYDKCGKERLPAPSNGPRASSQHVIKRPRTAKVDQADVGHPGRVGDVQDLEDGAGVGDDAEDLVGADVVQGEGAQRGQLSEGVAEEVGAQGAPDGSVVEFPRKLHRRNHFNRHGCVRRGHTGFG